MNKTEKMNISNNILSSLSKYYTEKGFKTKKSPAKFFSNEFEITWGYRSEFSSFLTFQPHFRVIFPKITTVLKTVFPNEIAYFTLVRAQNCEFANELGVADFDNSPFNYRDEYGTYYHYKINNETNLQPIIKDHINFMEKVGFPFFEKMSTLEGIDDYINGRVLKGDKAYFQTEERQKEVKSFLIKEKY